MGSAWHWKHGSGSSLHGQQALIRMGAQAGSNDLGGYITASGDGVAPSPPFPWLIPYRYSVCTSVFMLCLPTYLSKYTHELQLFDLFAHGYANRQVSRFSPAPLLLPLFCSTQLSQKSQVGTRGSRDYAIDFECVDKLPTTYCLVLNPQPRPA
jgi:hypothetical protein